MPAFAPIRLPRHFALRLAMLAGALWLAGCSAFPALDRPLTEADEAQGFPALVPVEGLLAGSTTQSIVPETQTRLEDRRAALERRAAALRGVGLEPETRDRMQAGVSAQQP